MNPTKQGLKRQFSKHDKNHKIKVLAHESNKTRIETHVTHPIINIFRCLSPWIQQNKDWNSKKHHMAIIRFLSLSPWIQQNKDWNYFISNGPYGGIIVLAHESNKTRIETPRSGSFSSHPCHVLAHESNKTRIETYSIVVRIEKFNPVLAHESNKTRIETDGFNLC